ncbi:hypothetical protein PS941_01097 [Pseudomonas fluorescens]|uniref:Uncharacterized protein n=1 Tax=Pseudomonas fluorescens TaxID=294 RepID=A0A5E7SFR9_PSEFL|nr:hypothetical protein PS941_01097 [Pseudomonas fluorescens]
MAVGALAYDRIAGLLKKRADGAGEDWVIIHDQNSLAHVT